MLKSKKGMTKSIVWVVLISFVSLNFQFAVAQSQDYAPQSRDDSSKEIVDTFSALGETVIFNFIKKFTGYDASLWWLLARILNAIPSSSRKFEPIKFDPAYENMTTNELQIRYGQYIVARSHVQQMPATPGSYAAIKVLTEEIDKMNEDLIKRNGHLKIHPL